MPMESPLSEAKARIVPTHSFAEKVGILVREAERGKREPVIRELAAHILAHKGGSGWQTPVKNDEAEVKRLFEWVRSNIRYTRDVDGHDTFQRALRTLQLKIGDCDDMSVLLASLLGTVGYPARFKVVDTTGDGWDHIYVLAGLPPENPSRWVALDTTVDKPFGWEVPDGQIKRSRVFALQGANGGAKADDGQLLWVLLWVVSTLKLLRLI